MYRIEFISSAAKEFRYLPTELKQQIEPIIEGLIQNPRPQGVRKLVGHENLYRVRVGQYRIVFKIDDDASAMCVTRVRHRREAYP